MSSHTGVESVPDVQDDELRVLGVTVSRALFAIRTDETRVHLQTLEYELTLMQFDTALPPSDAMVRASTHCAAFIAPLASFRSAISPDCLKAPSWLFGGLDVRHNR